MAAQFLHVAPAAAAVRRLRKLDKQQGAGGVCTVCGRLGESAGCGGWETHMERHLGQQDGDCTGSGSDVENALDLACEHHRTIYMYLVCSRNIRASTRLAQLPVSTSK